MSQTNQNNPEPLTEKQKQEQIIRFLTQKRESYAQGILFNLCHMTHIESPSQGAALVDVAVEMADHLLEKLYPIKEEEAAE